MTPSEVRGRAYIQDFKELKVGREVIALVHVSVVRYQSSRDHLISLITLSIVVNCMLY